MTNIIRLLKRKAVERVGLAAYKEEKENAYKILVGKHEGKKKIRKIDGCISLHLTEYAVKGVRIRRDLLSVT